MQKTWLNRLETISECLLEVKQNVFSKESSTTKGSFILQQMIEEKKKYITKKVTWPL